MNAASKDSILGFIAGMRLKVQSLDVELDQLQALVLRDAEPEEKEDFDPKDARNKRPDGTLTSRGEEICYRLFDAGLNRNQVRKAMDIAHGAASSRMIKWQKLGGVNRIRRPLG